jgi:hypothetical protein
MKALGIILGIGAAIALTGCSSGAYISASSDLYAVHNRTELARLEIARAELEKAEAEAAKARYEAQLAQIAVEQAAAEANGETIEGKYARRIVMFDEYDYYVRPNVIVAYADPWGWSYNWGSPWWYYSYDPWLWGYSYNWGWYAHHHHYHGGYHGYHGGHYDYHTPRKNQIHRDTDRTYANGYRSGSGRNNAGSSGAGSRSGVTGTSRFPSNSGSTGSGYTSGGGRNRVNSSSGYSSGSSSSQPARSCHPSPRTRATQSPASPTQ